MQASVIVNRRSRRTETFIDRLPGILRERDIGTGDIEVVDDNDDMRRLVRRAVKRGVKYILVGGGDGSMTHAVDALAHSDSTMGVIPLGTGNSFAATLQIPDSLEAALDVIKERRIAKVDLGVVNGTHFANFATVGLSSEIARAAPFGLKKLAGPLAYVLGALKPLLKQKPFEADVRWDDGHLNFQTLQMIVASGRFFGHQPLAPDASITDGRLSFFTTTGVSHAEIARTYLALFAGAQEHLPDAKAFSAREIAIKAKPRQLVCIDGDVFGRTPATFSIARKALNVIVPESFVNDRD